MRKTAPVYESPLRPDLGFCLRGRLSRGLAWACARAFFFLDSLCLRVRYITHPARFVPRLFPYIGPPPTDILVCPRAA